MAPWPKRSAGNSAQPGAKCVVPSFVYIYILCATFFRARSSSTGVHARLRQVPDAYQKNEATVLPGNGSELTESFRRGMGKALSTPSSLYFAHPLCRSFFTGTCYGYNNQNTGRLVVGCIVKPAGCARTYTKKKRICVCFLVFLFVVLTSKRITGPLS